MSVLETVLCDWLDLHSYDQDSVQNDTGYVRKTCTRCGDSKYYPR